MYGHDPGLLEVLVLRRCVNTIEAKMEMAFYLRKMDVKLTQVWGAKVKASQQLSPSRIVCRC